jgi:hypothetical protein
MLEKLEFFLMRKITSKTLMDSFTKMKANKIGKTEIKRGDSLFIRNENESTHVGNLNKNGYTQLDF